MTANPDQEVVKLELEDDNKICAETPVDHYKDQNGNRLQKLIKELFSDIKNGNGESISKLRSVNADEFLAIKKVHNNEGITLLEVAIANKHKNIATKLLNMIMDEDQVELQFSPECELDQFEKLKSAAEVYIRCSECYLTMLQCMSQPYGSEKNTFRGYTLKQGSYYLGIAYSLVEVYKDCIPGSIDNNSIQSVNDTLLALEFDPDHISSEWTDEGTANHFVSKGQGTQYYNLLHSELKKDVRSFLEMVELNIDIPVKRFLESITERLQSVDLKDQNFTSLQKLINELFNDIKNGNAQSIIKLRSVKPDELLAITNARNDQGHTLLQVAIANKHKNIASTLLKLLQELDEVQLQLSPECELDQLKNLKTAAEKHISSSKCYLSTLQCMSEPYGSKKNRSPWKTFKEGFCYLENAYHLVVVYKDCVLGLIDNKSIQSVNNMLIALEFDPEHMSSRNTDEACGGKAECLVSKSQSTIYYKLLHSELKKDVRSFIEMVELNIDIPVNRFLESINRRLQSVDLEDQNCTNLQKLITELFRDIKNGNAKPISKLKALKPNEVLAVKKARNDQGHTLLQVAIVNKHMDIAKKLLKMLKRSDYSKLQFGREYELYQLAKLKSYAEHHISCSKVYLPALRNTSYPDVSQTNFYPWKTLKDGSYHLGNAYTLVELFKESGLGVLDNKSIYIVDDLLVALEFNPEHITSEPIDNGTSNRFVSKGQGTVYYNLLHSDLKKDVRSFIKMVEDNIDIPIERFLESIKQRFRLLET